VTVLPPALIAQWHFMPDNNVRPYAGAGINYTMFFSESTTDQFTNTIDAVAGPGVTSTGLSVDDTFGIVYQAGVDIDINKDWYVNFDAKYIDMDTTATVQVNGVDTATVDFDLNPWVLGVGVGTKF
jgi:outer membrane protein